MRSQKPFKDDLSRYTSVYCDSKLALEQAWEAGLPRTARVLTSSPALLSEACAVPVHRDFGAQDRAALNGSTLDLTLKIFKEMSLDRILEPYAALVARMSILFQPTIAQAASLQNDDFEQPRAIILSHVGHEPIDRLFRAPWSALFANAPHAATYTFPIPMHQTYGVLGGTTPSISTRARQAGWEKFAYRMLLGFGRYIPRALTRGRAFIFSENELLIETCAWLGLTGYSLYVLPRPNANLRDKQALELESTETSLRKNLTPVLESHIGRWVGEYFIASTMEIFFKKVLSEVSLSLSLREAWATSLDQNAIGGKDVVLMNYPGGGAIQALRVECQNRNVPTISFEHGATRQFCATHKHMVAGFENNHTDWVMAFNTLSSEMSNNNPFSNGTSIPVGFPKDYFRNCEQKPEPDRPPILFVSTTLYIGNLQSLSGSLCDIDAAEREIAIITNVLTKVPHTFSYKPYPSPRYADPDPIHDIVRASDNIEFYEKGVDLRYEVGKYRVIVTSRATSTVSWCLMSGKPLVFIDYPDHMPLTEDAREAFRKGTFLIDVSEEGWQEKLRMILSKPIGEIEAESLEKAADRARLISDFFTIPEAGAGRRAARHIRQIASGNAADTLLASCPGTS